MWRLERRCGDRRGRGRCRESRGLGIVSNLVWEKEGGGTSGFVADDEGYWEGFGGIGEEGFRGKEKGLERSAGERHFRQAIGVRTVEILLSKVSK